MKVYGLLTMLLIGLLVPMTVASKSIGFESMHQLKTKFIDKEEVVIQNIRFNENSAFLYVEPHEQISAIDTGVSNLYIRARGQADSATGYINKGRGLLNAVNS